MQPAQFAGDVSPGLVGAPFGDPDQAARASTGWGLLLTVPSALLQGYIFQRTRSLTYVVTVHLSFAVVIFGILVHAYNPGLTDVFVTDPR